MRILGANFGILGGRDSVTVTYAEAGSATTFSARNCSVTEPSNTEIVCISSEGWGGSHVWSVSIDGVSRGSAVSLVRTSYVVPQISSIESPPDGIGLDGGDEVILHGTNFGSEGLLLGAAYGSSASGFFCTSCTVTVAHSSAICNTTQSSGGDLRWRVFFQERAGGNLWASDLSSVSISSKAPTVTNVEVLGSQFLSTYGGTGVALTGRHFGTPGEIRQTGCFGGNIEAVSLPPNKLLYGSYESIRCTV